MCVIGLEWIENHRSVSIVGCPQAGRDEPMSRAGTTLHGVGARGGLRRRKVRHGCCRNQGLVDMASALLRRQLAHKIALPQRCLFSSTSSVLAQAAPQSQSSSSTTNTTTATPPGSKKAFNRHIAEELQGVSASEILAESGTRKDAQMRHFTGEGIWSFFFVYVLPEGPIGLTIAPSSPS